MFISLSFLCSNYLNGMFIRWPLQDFNMLLLVVRWVKEVSKVVRTKTFSNLNLNRIHINIDWGECCPHTKCEGVTVSPWATQFLWQLKVNEAQESCSNFWKSKLKCTQHCSKLHCSKPHIAQGLTVHALDTYFDFGTRLYDFWHNFTPIF